MYINPFIELLDELKAQQEKKRHLRDFAEAIDVEYEEIYEQPKDNDNENNRTMVE